MKTLAPTFFLAASAGLAGCTLVGDLSQAARPEVDIVAANGTRIEAVRGSYCWTSGGTGVCADTLAPPDLLKGKAAAVVPGGTAVEFRFVPTPSADTVRVNRWEEQTSRSTGLDRAGRLVVPTAPGTYSYDVSARWPQGDAFFAFMVEVK